VTGAAAMDSNQRIARQVGGALRRLRLKRRKTQQQLADAAGISVAALDAYECGQQYPDVQARRQLLAALRVSPVEFGRHLGPRGIAGDWIVWISVSYPRGTTADAGLSGPALGRPGDPGGNAA
jgi:transcriptional regulator with XRE-family HTH domain